VSASLAERVARQDADAKRASGCDADDHRRVALTSVPKGLSARELDAVQRDLLRALLATDLGRVPDGLPPHAPRRKRGHPVQWKMGPCRCRSCR